MLEASLSVFFTQFVVVRIDVFCLIIDLVVLGDGDGTGVVTMEGSGDGHLEINKSFLNTEELPACMGEVDVFRLGSGSGDNVLLP